MSKKEEEKIIIKREIKILCTERNKKVRKIEIKTKRKRK